MTLNVHVLALEVAVMDNLKRILLVGAVATVIVAVVVLLIPVFWMVLVGAGLFFIGWKLNDLLNTLDKPKGG